MQRWSREPHLPSNLGYLWPQQNLTLRLPLSRQVLEFPSLRTIRSPSHSEPSATFDGALILP